MKRSNRTGAALAVKAATDNPGLWCGDGLHSASIWFDKRYNGQYLIRPDAESGYSSMFVFNTRQEAIEALTEAWQAEDARRRQSARSAALDGVAQAAGYETWRQLETAAKNGQQIVINEEVQG